ncbi:MAG: hypothetical protein KIS66_13100 [Fimbriimonadaceae bacterium]|nr:hypothetical protein [Fimbriimonadaceae bacterium]
MKRSLALIPFLALAAISMAQEPTQLEWKPQVGRVLKYKLNVKASMDMGAGAQDLLVGMLLTSTTKEVRPNGEVVVETKQGGMSLSIGGQDMSAMVGEMVTTETATMNKRGETLSRKSDAPEGMDNHRLTEAITFIYPEKPLKVGDTWTREVKADAAKGVRAGLATFKFEGVDTVDGKWKANKITYTYKETEGSDAMSCAATVWIGAEDGELVKGEYKMKNFTFAPQAPPGDAIATVVRQG